MCAVVGIYSNTKVDINKFFELINQSMIRGKHATGLSWIDDGVLKNAVFPIPANEMSMPDIETNMIIGHCRYSTSDLEFNQPIYTNNISIVHNGVISQAEPETWEKKYGYKFTSRNDSEILLRSWEKNKHPLEHDGSMAAIVIDNTETPRMHFFRNEQRPLYYAKTDDAIYITSTADILKRSGINGYKKTIACIDYEIDDFVLKETVIKDYVEDLQ